jgi:arylsulfatase A-like enzyme
MALRPLPLALNVLVLAAALAVVAGAALVAFELRLLPSGHRAVLLPLAATSVTRAWLTALAALAVWLVVFALGARIRSAPARSLLATAIPGVPLGLLAILEVNRSLLPDFATIESTVGNLAMGVGLVFLLALGARGLRTWAERLDRAPRAMLLVLLVPVALQGALRATLPTGPNVIVILVDVLRADELGCYGYERDTSPHIDRLAEDGVLFEHAIAQSTFTKTSVASLFTGRWPHEHGVFEGSQENEEGRIVSDVLDGGMTTLAESLAEAGYLTAAWVQNEQLRGFLGFDQGFALYRDQPGDCETIFREFLEWRERWGRRQPFFAYLHLLDLHAPYRPEPPWDERYFDLPDDWEPTTWEDWIVYKKRVRKGEITPWPRQVELLRALYDGQLAWIDERVGALLDELRANGAYDDSLIIFTSDHGDAFMEHGAFSHSNTPYEELIRVPLIVKLPGSRNAGRRVDDAVASIDLVATLEELLGADGIGAHGDGRSLAPYLDGEGSHGPRVLLSMFKNMVAVRDGRWKLIQTFDTEPELYDLEADPGETRNLAEAEPEIVGRLRPLALAAIQHKLESRSEQAALSPETVQKLRELGYIE